MFGIRECGSATNHAIQIVVLQRVRAETIERGQIKEAEQLEGILDSLETAQNASKFVQAEIETPQASAKSPCHLPPSRTTLYKGMFARKETGEISLDILPTKLPK